MKSRKSAFIGKSIRNPKSEIRNSQKAYAQAGVDVDLGNEVKSGIQQLVQATHGPEVLGKIGGFGGLFRPNFRGMKDPVLVSSVDGVGTKLKVAFMVNKHDTVGQDLVNHCINDIAVIGARPLFFLDYLAAARLDPKVFRELLKGFAKACKSGGCALIGGETAQMPGMYQPGEYDVAGCIVGVVDRSRLIDGSKIKAGDAIIGLHSTGLHTNGYSLARKILFEQLKLKPTDLLPGTRRTVAAELLRVHPNYEPILRALPQGVIKGAVHVTGGGLIDNFPRVLPKQLDAVIDTTAWKVPVVFQLLQEAGFIPRLEMFQVFNMGIGMALVVDSNKATVLAKKLKGRVIGRIQAGSGRVILE